MKDFLRNYGLAAIVFFTGACVLVVEIVATRILSPYFGNTIFTFSSVISIVLAALSIGYFYGGRLADRMPGKDVFFALVLLSGISVFFIYLMMIYLLPAMGSTFSIIMGPLVSSLALFFIPAVILGTLSPFAVKLQTVFTPEKGMGTIAGEIFFWSTLGSITGSLLAGFVLIPLAGVRAIMLGVAIALTAVGALLLAGSGACKKKALHERLLMAALAVGVSTTWLFFHQPPHNLLYQKDGVYERLSVFDTIYKGKPARLFQQDMSSSGGMYLMSDTLIFDYTQYYKLYRIFNPGVRNALVIGGGAYSIPKAILSELPGVQVDVSEIEPSLPRLSQEFFRAPVDEPRLRNFIADGRRMLKDADRTYGLIFSDVYFSIYSLPSHFTTVEFFETAKNALDEDGIFIANLIADLSRQRPSFIMPEIKTFMQVFPNHYFFAVNNPADRGAQNIIAVGYNSDRKIDFDDPGIRYSPDPIIRDLKGKLIDMNRFELSPYPVLTDDYAPTEYLNSGTLRRSFRRNGGGNLDGGEMLALVEQQVRYGARNPTAPGHARMVDFLAAEMAALADEVHRQSWTHDAADGQSYELTNVIARFNPHWKKRILLAAHYDTKKHASMDRRNPGAHMPGANDGASGVAVLLELARYLANTENPPRIGVDIVFFDGEEGEEGILNDFSKWRPLGSEYFTDNIPAFYPDSLPIGGIVLDMVCDKDLTFYQEASSLRLAPGPVEDFWRIAGQLYPDIFIKEKGRDIRDDHIALNAAGIPSFVVIDIDYPHYHTTRDTPGKCSAKSLEAVGTSVLEYLYSVNEKPA